MPLASMWTQHTSKLQLGADAPEGGVGDAELAVVPGQPRSGVGAAQARQAQRRLLRLRRTPARGVVALARGGIASARGSGVGKGRGGVGKGRGGDGLISLHGANNRVVRAHVRDDDIATAPLLAPTPHPPPTTAAPHTHPPAPLTCSASRSSPRVASFQTSAAWQWSRCAAAQKASQLPFRPPAWAGLPLVQIWKAGGGMRQGR